ncbi:hypothetical protein CAPTEDRAFT_200589 [Capitella teleta]|uniref:G-protein coupled receptors family 1 profile domain-containing protein n=1 Tax=Capitella teleta TaxID=283909 RepID=R7T892_CAPTE|nr:hypothetical protein CAPTEDRAFT_200589 [Capitella teleta]|eukprot:ELT89894.1 hypothetical protein CAPTEDRAFT_200589 [Capitella teleta]
MASNLTIYTTAPWQVIVNQAIGVSFILASPLICVGNFASIVGIIQEYRLHTTTMGLILNMAFADFLTGIFVCGYEAFVYLKDEGLLLHYKWYCHWVNFLAIIFIGQSLFTNLLLSVERYIAICHPFKHLIWVTKNRLLICVLCGWFYCISMALVPLVTERNRWDKILVACTPKHVYPKMFVMFIYVHIVAVVISNFYFQIRVAQQVFKQHKRISEMLQIHPANAKVLDRKAEIKKGKLTVILFLAFMICWGPYIVASPLNVYVNSELLLAVRDTSFVLGTFNSFSNFFIYTWKNKELRHSAFRVFKCDFGSRQHGASSSTATNSSQHSHRLDTIHA